MRNILPITLALLALLGCSEDPYGNLGSAKEFFSKKQVGSSHDYGIIKFGNPEDHVATVHGFGDDGESCREIADSMNANACKETGGQQCLNPYSCDALN
jgi:hypothetical protein